MSNMRKAAKHSLPSGATVLLRQHFFDVPVLQPRLHGASADRSGLKNWPCAVPLLAFIEAKVLPQLRRARLAHLGRSVRPLRVLELGSGCGLLGLGLAAGATDVRVLLTDPDVPTAFGAPAEQALDSTLDWLRSNVTLNAGEGGAVSTTGTWRLTASRTYRSKGI